VGVARRACAGVRAKRPHSPSLTRSIGQSSEPARMDECTNAGGSRSAWPCQGMVGDASGGDCDSDGLFALAQLVTGCDTDDQFGYGLDAGLDSLGGGTELAALSVDADQPISLADAAFFTHAGTAGIPAKLSTPTQPNDRPVPCAPALVDPNHQQHQALTHDHTRGQEQAAEHARGPLNAPPSPHHRDRKPRAFRTNDAKSPTPRRRVWAAVEQDALAKLADERMRGNDSPFSEAGGWKDWALCLGTKDRNRIIAKHRLTPGQAADLKKSARKKKQGLSQTRYRDATAAARARCGKKGGARSHAGGRRSSQAKPAVTEVGSFPNSTFWTGGKPVGKGGHWLDIQADPSHTSRDGDHAL